LEKLGRKEIGAEDNRAKDPTHLEIPQQSTWVTPSGNKALSPHTDQTIE